jgi:hypothetical protein
MKKAQQKNLLIAVLLILFAAAMRLFIDIPNVTPIAAIALFAAAVIKDKKWAIILPISILFISDIIIGFYEYQIMLAVYFSFLLIAGIGYLIRKKINVQNIALASISGSVIFFIVSNFAVWIMWYPKSIAGIIQAYTLAIPFFKYEVLGTAAYTTLLFGAYYLLKQYALKAETIRK